MWRLSAVRRYIFKYRIVNFVIFCIDKATFLDYYKIPPSESDVLSGEKSQKTFKKVVDKGSNA